VCQRAEQLELSQSLSQSFELSAMPDHRGAMTIAERLAQCHPRCQIDGTLLHALRHEFMTPRRDAKKASGRVGGKRPTNETSVTERVAVSVELFPSKEIFGMVQYEDRRPVWTTSLFNEFRRINSLGQTWSPGVYPHSAEDVLLACKTFLTDEHKTGRIAVMSSLSPWLELTLLVKWGSGAVDTIDSTPIAAPGYTPIIHAPDVKIRALPMAELPDLYASSHGSGVYDLIVSFSGVEHDGLGRNGDPVNDDGDVAAVREMRMLLKPNGRLLLAVPTADNDSVVWPKTSPGPSRLYGPTRLPQLMEGLQLLGRVWDGQVVHGGLETASRDPKIYQSVHGDVRRQKSENIDAAAGCRTRCAKQQGTFFSLFSSTSNCRKSCEDTAWKEAAMSSSVSWQHQQVYVLRRGEFSL